MREYEIVKFEIVKQYYLLIFISTHRRVFRDTIASHVNFRTDYCAIELFSFTEECNIEMRYCGQPDFEKFEA